MPIIIPRGLTASQVVDFYVQQMAGKCRLSALQRSKLQSHCISGFYPTGSKYQLRLQKCAGFAEIVRNNQTPTPLVFDDSGCLHDVSEVVFGEYFSQIWRCNVTTCAVCTAAKARKRRALLFQAVPLFKEKFPDHQFIFLTLTQKTVPLELLRKQFKSMYSGFKRLYQSKFFPADGYIRCIEVKKSKKKGENDETMVHPHIHAILPVPSSYFSSDSYLIKDKWIALWKRSMRLDYDPSVDVRAVYLNSESVRNVANTIDENTGQADSSDSSDSTATLKAVIYATKYVCKPNDLITLGNEIPLYHEQVKGTKILTVGGCMSQFISQAKLDYLEKTGLTGEEQSQFVELKTLYHFDDCEYSNVRTDIVQSVIAIDDNDSDC